MIVNPRITEYIDSLESSQGSLLDSIEEEAREALVPIIRRETGALLRTLITAAAPTNIWRSEQQWGIPLCSCTG